MKRNFFRNSVWQVVIFLVVGGGNLLADQQTLTRPSSSGKTEVEAPLSNQERPEPLNIYDYKADDLAEGIRRFVEAMRVTEGSSEAEGSVHLPIEAYRQWLYAFSLKKLQTHLSESDAKIFQGGTKISNQNARLRSSLGVSAGGLVLLAALSAMPSMDRQAAIIVGELSIVASVVVGMMTNGWSQRAHRNRLAAWTRQVQPQLNVEYALLDRDLDLKVYGPLRGLLSTLYGSGPLADGEVPLPAFRKAAIENLALLFEFAKKEAASVFVRTLERLKLETKSEKDFSRRAKLKHITAELNERYAAFSVELDRALQWILAAEYQAVAGSNLLYDPQIKKVWDIQFPEFGAQCLSALAKLRP